MLAQAKARARARIDAELVARAEASARVKALGLALQAWQRLPSSRRTLAATALIAALLLAVLHAISKEGQAPALQKPVDIAFPPLTLPPKVLPQQLRTIAPQEARSLNAQSPFVRDGLDPAKPFRFVGTADSVARATDCLAAAAWYEAGDDPSGERAVIQVVLNRLRSRAFPATVCGVVFEGSDRSTGCQFTFTCDGSLARIPSQQAWDRARLLARQALLGAVDQRVGLATHYHADWVVPYWSSSLDKVAQVGPHIFYRWRGFWGRPHAFSRKLEEIDEAPVAKLAMLSLPHRASGSALAAIEQAAAAPPPPAPAKLPDPIQLPGVREKSLRGALVRGEASHIFFIQVDPATFPGNYATAAVAICKGRAQCTVLGWRDPQRIEVTMPLSAAGNRALTFYYHRDGKGDERALWNCDQVERANKNQCLPSETAGPGGLVD